LIYFEEQERTLDFIFSFFFSFFIFFFFVFSSNFLSWVAKGRKVGREKRLARAVQSEQFKSKRRREEDKPPLFFF